MLDGGRGALGSPKSMPLPNPSRKWLDLSLMYGTHLRCVQVVPQPPVEAPEECRLAGHHLQRPGGGAHNFPTNPYTPL